MKRFSSMLKGSKRRSSKTPSVNIDNAAPDSPEATVARSIQDFCQSIDNDAEVIHLPVIVDSAECSPVACTAAAQQIRKFLTKDYSKSPQTQTKAVMLIRILSDNPGPNFTRNFDKQFTDTVKTCLRNCNDPTTQQLLRETLDTIEFNKGYDETVKGLVSMWQKEKGANFSYAAVSRPVPGGMHMSGGRSNRQLPPPEELGSRIEEAKNTAKILLQLIQTTPSDQVLSNDLLREFGDRCHMAIKSMQNYMNSTAPVPDDDTMQTLIETTEQLSLANSRYQRTMLAARRAAGLSSPSPRNEAAGSVFAPPSGPPTGTGQATTNGHGSAAKSETFAAPSGPPPNTTSSTGAPTLPPLNPFADPEPQSTVPQTTQNFAINTEPTYAGTGSARPDVHTSHSNNDDPYSSSPVRTRPAPNVLSGSQVSEIDSHGQVGRATNQR